MFWRKKEENNVEYDGLPVTLSKRNAVIKGLFGYEHITKQFLAYKQNDEWKGLVGYEEYKAKTDLLEKKLDLILKELGKEYVSESEKKEPAKLVTKLGTLGTLKAGAIVKMPEDWGVINVCAGSIADKPKKKRKTTKKKK